MINARRHNHQIALLQPDSHPVVILASDIKVPASSEYVPDLLVFVQMFVEEVLHLLFVAGERGGADLDLVSVLVVPILGDFVDAVEIVGEFVVDYAERGEVGWVDEAAGVVGLALVALDVVLGLGCGWLE